MGRAGPGARGGSTISTFQKLHTVALSLLIPRGMANW